MNKKLFFNLIFYIVGTFILVSMAGVVYINFTKDARIFQAPAVIAEEEVQSSGTPAAKKEETKTINYQRNEDTETEKSDKTPAPEKTGEDKGDKEKIKVEIINYSGQKSLGQDIKSTLEASGFQVELRDDRTKAPLSTSIIERNERKAGSAVQKVLKFGKISKWPDPKSKFDVTIKIGNDFKP